MSMPVLPVCGDDEGSQREILKKRKQRLQSDPVHGPLFIRLFVLFNSRPADSCGMNPFTIRCRTGHYSDIYYSNAFRHIKHFASPECRKNLT
ncbi:MAG: hypothetical protein APR53_09325 [Methanoculleus sp. SDB]|nr:MAG: hypothetical protein APR53_09325 [Methanoculleus sp. SDB]